jgi:hypothetical protein
MEEYDALDHTISRVVAVAGTTARQHSQAAAARRAEMRA